MVTATQTEYKARTAKRFYSGFPQAHDTYNGLSPASDGMIYYILSSDQHNIAGQMYVHDPATQESKWLGDLTAICGEADQNCIAQGKSHVRFYESDKKLYFSTHVGYYQLIEGMDRLPVQAPDGMALYPGGHFLSYDLETGLFEDLGKIPFGEGVVSMTMDTGRKQLYGISWPTGRFLHFDVNKKQLQTFDPVSGLGEAGTPGEDFRSLCRSLFVVPETGTVYFSTAEGKIYHYTPGKDGLKPLINVDLRLDYFGKYDHTRPGSMCYNWRKIFWYAPEKVAYGIHGNSGYLFKFDPAAETIEIVERITSLPSRKSGMFDQFSYGYLGFQLGPDQETIFYLTGGPIYENGKRLKGEEQIAKGAAKGLENLHLITFHIPTQRYEDHGPVFYQDGERPTYVNSIGVARSGDIYALARMPHDERIIQDLIKIPNPVNAHA